MMMMSNRKSGTKFEDELCEILSAQGFWAHNLAQNSAGQPADVLTAKNNKPYLIDCKDCQNDKLSLSRIEPNQESAMTLWQQTGNTECYFALRSHTGVIYMAHLNVLITMRNSISQVNVDKFPTLEEWICKQL